MTLRTRSVNLSCMTSRLLRAYLPASPGPGFRFRRQMSAHQFGAQHVSLRRLERAVRAPLEVGWLREHQELVDGLQLRQALESERHTEAQRGTQIDDLLARHAAAVAQVAVRAPHLVLDLDPGIPHQDLAR